MEENKTEVLFEIGKRMAAARKAANITQEQAAMIGESTQQSISSAERGERYLPSDVVYRLCVAYGISVEYLMTGRWSETDTNQVDPRADQLTQEQFFNYRAMLKAINDHFFASHGIDYPDSDEGSR